MLNNKSVLITGGTGSFGKMFTKTLLKRYPDIKKLIILSRDELKQFEMAQEFPPQTYPAMRYYIGDVRDKDRLKRAFEGVDVIIHAAALKQVPTAEYNPFECIKTNVLGAQNIIETAIDSGVKKVVALSTDKAAAPINLYGATKLCSDKLFVAANNMKGNHDINFSVVRYGNVMGSRGSVIPFFMGRKNTGILPITHADMTRFNISLEEGVDLVLYALEHAIGGEIFVPKIPSYRITDLATAIAPNCKQEIVGIRPGEKLHEEMITLTDSFNTIKTHKHYIILPSMPFKTQEQVMEKYLKYYNAQPVAKGFSYNSGENDVFLSVEEIRTLIKNYVDPNFEA
ncbi:MAG: UDP-N-acetylglucosamine 4,6-dehydratase (inverting) [Bernardetiaceae bacterium]|nr:UDP-N-acetylglucosamine 4,6-dehydratase (inverting) [Bernardetiaceae bacterium]